MRCLPVALFACPKEGMRSALACGFTSRRKSQKKERKKERKERKKEKKKDGPSNTLSTHPLLSHTAPPAPTTTYPTERVLVFVLLEIEDRACSNNTVGTRRKTKRGRERKLQPCTVTLRSSFHLTSRAAQFLHLKAIKTATTPGCFLSPPPFSSLSLSHFCSLAASFSSFHPLCHFPSTTAGCEIGDCAHTCTG